MFIAAAVHDLRACNLELIFSPIINSYGLLYLGMIAGVCYTTGWAKNWTVWACDVSKVSDFV